MLAFCKNQCFFAILFFFPLLSSRRVTESSYLAHQCRTTCESSGLYSTLSFLAGWVHFQCSQQSLLFPLLKVDTALLPPNRYTSLLYYGTLCCEEQLLYKYCVFRLSVLLILATAACASHVYHQLGFVTPLFLLLGADRIQMCVCAA